MHSNKHAAFKCVMHTGEYYFESKSAKSEATSEDEDWPGLLLCDTGTRGLQLSEDSQWQGAASKYQ